MEKSADADLLREMIGFAAFTRLVGALLPERNDAWAVQRARDITLERSWPIAA